MADLADAPHFVIDSNPAEPGSAAEQVRYIEHSIHSNPEAFQKALERLGPTATAGTLDLSAIDIELTTLEQGASGLLTRFFSKRLDLNIEFDDATEDALAVDANHRTLIEQHRELRSVNSQIGKMTHEVVANPLAEPARDAVRRSRMAFYISRAIEYQRQHAPDALSSAG